MTLFSRRKALATLGAAAAVSTSGAFAQNVPKIAFAMNGKPGDVGWNYEHQRGVDMARAHFGSAVQIDTFYDIPEWGNGELQHFMTMVLNGYEMVFACSYGYANAMIQMALSVPNVRFEHCGGYVRADNMATYSARWYEGRVPQGLMAGAMTKTNRIGYLASFPIPQVVRGINAAQRAARSVNPNVEFDVVWLKTWFSPEAEESVARQLIERGADVLMAHTNSTKPVEVAEEMGAYAFGQASDMTKYGPNASLSSSINNWGPYYIKRIEALLNGNWTPTDTWGGYPEDMVSIGTLSDRIPEETRQRVMNEVKSIEARQTHPFVGPIQRQDGSIWLRAGEQPTDMELEQMSFYLDGMTSVYPGA